jgi:hypothetical protein
MKMAQVTQFSETGFSIGWGTHPRLAGLTASAQVELVLGEVEKATALCGVTDIMQVIPSGWNNGVAGPLRTKSHNGIKWAYYPVYEMINGVRGLSVERFDQATATATLYAAEKAIENFGQTPVWLTYFRTTRAGQFISCTRPQSEGVPFGARWKQRPATLEEIAHATRGES